MNDLIKDYNNLVSQRIEMENKLKGRRTVLENLCPSNKTWRANISFGFSFVQKRNQTSLGGK